MNKIKCRICRKDSPTNGKICLGCGTPVQNAIDRSKQKKNVLRCPRCKSNRYKSDNTGFCACSDCGAHFEHDDFHFVDDRPENNAIKKERR